MGPPGREGSPGKDVSVGVLWGLWRGWRESGKCASLGGHKKLRGWWWWRLVLAEARGVDSQHWSVVSQRPAPWVLPGVLRAPWDLGVRPHSLLPEAHSS